MLKSVKNIKSQAIDGVLYLKGVHLSDLGTGNIEDFLHERLLPRSEAPMKIYDKIPMVFTGLDTWPKSTNLLCWNCNMSIKGRPWFEPQSIDPICQGSVGEFIPSDKLKRGGVMPSHYSVNTKGCFCSPNCTMRYILTHSKTLPERHNKTAMLLIIHEIFMKRYVSDIIPAPPVTDMIQYGGTMTEADYQKKLSEYNSFYQKQLDDGFIANCRVFLANAEDSG